jgi:DNA-binding response OmpR family regulator
MSFEDATGPATACLADGQPGPEGRADRPVPKVLVAEDDATTGALLRGLLTKAGYEVSLCADGLEAWQELARPFEGQAQEAGRGLGSRGHDLLLCDRHMPGLDGRELVRRIRAHPGLRPMYVILVTADSALESLVSGLELGADDYVTKPFRPAELVARVRSGMRIRRLQQELAVLEHQLAAVHVATTASHEINNPLMILLGNWELLRRRLEPRHDPEIDKRLDAIALAAERIRQVTLKLRALRSVRLTSYVHQHSMIDLSASAEVPGPYLS